MKTLTKVAIVLLGYLAAVLIAFQVLAFHVNQTANDSLGSDGMYAFGDSLLFLGVFGLIALLPTAAAVYFLRANKSFWTGLTTTALVVGATAPLAILIYLTSHDASDGGIATILSFLALMRLLASPLLFLLFLVCGAFASLASSRKKLFLASALDALAILYMVLFWFLGLH